jgi:threonine/homoserine/homoserine lactone efflux protein
MILDPTLLAAYVVAATALALSPGPDTMFVLASSASGGARSGVAATLGIASGALVHATLAALGVSALIAASPVAFDVLRICGAVYLLWIGGKALVSFVQGLRAGDASSASGSGERDFWSAYRRGLTTNILNPKVGIFYVAFLPQFANPELGHVPLQIFLLGLIHNLIGVIWLVGLAALSGRAAEAFARNRRVRAWLDGVAGVVYVGLALRIFLLDRRPA